MTSSEVQILRQEIAELSKTLEVYIKTDEAWKVRAEPVVKAFENTSWAFKTLIWGLKIIGLMGAAGAIIITTTNYFRHQ